MRDDIKIDLLPVKKNFLPTVGSSDLKPLPVVNTTTKNKMINLDFIGDIAQAIPKVTGQFNSDYQQAQVQIAQANAQASIAQSQSRNSNQNPDNNKFLIIGAIAVIAIIGFFVFNSKK